MIMKVDETTGSLYTIEDFFHDVDHGFIISEDGAGYFSDGVDVFMNERVDVSWIETIEDLEQSGRQMVMWYNR